MQVAVPNKINTCILYIVEQIILCISNNVEDILSYLIFLYYFHDTKGYLIF